MLLLNELKRVALGEFIDDLELGNKASLLFGFKINDSSVFDEKIS